MRTLEATGKSIDEAIFNGLRELQISIDEVEIDIIQQETKGVFGIGAKPAIVRLIEREPEKIVIPDYVANKDMPRERRERRDNRGAGTGANGNRGRPARRAPKPGRSPLNPLLLNPPKRKPLPTVPPGPQKQRRASAANAGTTANGATGTAAAAKTTTAPPSFRARRSTIPRKRRKATLQRTS